MFESGIGKYVHARAVVDVYFPVDEKGNEYIRCTFCPLYNAHTRRCMQTQEILAFPDKYVGAYCKLKESEEEE